MISAPLPESCGKDGCMVWLHEGDLGVGGRYEFNSIEKGNSFKCELQSVGRHIKVEALRVGYFFNYS